MNLSITIQIHDRTKSPVDLGRETDLLLAWITGKDKTERAAKRPKAKSTVEQETFEFRFALPTGRRMYRNLQTGQLVMFEKRNNEWVPVDTERT